MAFAQRRKGRLSERERSILEYEPAPPRGYLSEPCVPAGIECICFKLVGVDRFFLLEPSSPTTSARDTARMSVSRALGFMSEGPQQLPAGGDVKTLTKALRSPNTTSTRASKASIRKAFL